MTPIPTPTRLTTTTIALPTTTTAATRSTVTWVWLSQSTPLQQVDADEMRMMLYATGAASGKGFRAWFKSEYPTTGGNTNMFNSYVHFSMCYIMACKHTICAIYFWNDSLVYINPSDMLVCLGP